MEFKNREEMLFLAESSVEELKEQSSSSLGEIDLWMEETTSSPKFFIQQIAGESSAVEFRSISHPDSMVIRLDKGDIIKICLAHTRNEPNQVRVRFIRGAEKLIPKAFLAHPQSPYFATGRDYIVIQPEDLSLERIIYHIRMETGVRIELDLVLLNNGRFAAWREPDWLANTPNKRAHLIIGSD